MHRTTILLPESLDIRLTAAARWRGTSRTEIIRLALEDFLSRDVRPRPPFIGIGHSGGGDISSENIKDLYRDHLRQKLSR